MIFWIDAQLSPALAPWITQQFGIEAYSVEWLGYRDATDQAIFQAAREAGTTVMTKTSDRILPNKPANPDDRSSQPRPHLSTQQGHTCIRVKATITSSRPAAAILDLPIRRYIPHTWI